MQAMYPKLQTLIYYIEPKMSTNLNTLNPKPEYDAVEPEMIANLNTLNLTP